MKKKVTKNSSLKHEKKDENNNKLINKFSFESFGGNRNTKMKDFVTSTRNPRDSKTDENLAFSWMAFERFPLRWGEMRELKSINEWNKLSIFINIPIVIVQTNEKSYWMLITLKWRLTEGMEEMFLFIRRKKQQPADI